MAACCEPDGAKPPCFSVRVTDAELAEGGLSVDDGLEPLLAKLRASTQAVSADDVHGAGQSNRCGAGQCGNEF